MRSPRSLDARLLGEATDLLNSIDPSDQVTATVTLTSFGLAVVQLWDTADRVTALHRLILAALDGGILAALKSEQITEQWLRVFREALSDLSMQSLSQVQVDSIQSQMIDLGKKPLAILGGLPYDSEYDAATATT
jgi:hypothetical protein